MDTKKNADWRLVIRAIRMSDCADQTFQQLNADCATGKCVARRERLVETDIIIIISHHHHPSSESEERSKEKTVKSCKLRTRQTFKRDGLTLCSQWHFCQPTRTKKSPREKHWLSQCVENKLLRKSSSGYFFTHAAFRSCYKGCFFLLHTDRKTILLVLIFAYLLCWDIAIHTACSHIHCPKSLIYFYTKTPH